MEYFKKGYYILDCDKDRLTYLEDRSIYYDLRELGPLQFYINLGIDHLEGEMDSLYLDENGWFYRIDADRTRPTDASIRNFSEEIEMLSQEEVEYVQNDVEVTKSAFENYEKWKGERKIMGKVKAWFKEHKNEIIVGTVAAGVAGLYILLREDKIQMNGGIRINLRIGDDFRFNCKEGKPNDSIYTTVTLNNPKLTIDDLGELGKILKQKLPDLAETGKISEIFTSYNYFKEK